MSKKLKLLIILFIVILSVITVSVIVFADTDIKLLANTVVEKLIKYNVKEGSQVRVPNNIPTKDGYDFLGWQLEGDTSDKLYQPNELITILDSMSSNGKNIDFTAVYGERYTVKYAVRIYGIMQDEDENGNPCGLTFGPAGGYLDDEGHTYIYTGTSNNSKYKSCGDNDLTCLHNMTWDDIIEVSKTNPHQFDKCMVNRCTHSVLIDLTDKIIMGEDYGPKGTVENYAMMKDSDGASALYNSINPSSYRNWNYGGMTLGGWQESAIRNMLNGPAAVDENGNLAINSVSVRYAVGENDCLFSAFPQVLQDNIVAKKVISASAQKRTSDLDISYDNLWLFSSKEMYKPDGYNYSTMYIDDREGELYQSQNILDAIGTNSVSALTVNRFYSELGSNVWSWSCSLCYGYASSAVGFNTFGNPDWSNVGSVIGVSPGFCLAGPEPYTVKYAVRIYGINQDIGENGQVLGLTFGPAGGYGDSDKGEHTYVYSGVGTSGANKNEGYKSCGDDDTTCLHNLTWQEIVDKLNSSDRDIFLERMQICMVNRCTHSVLIDLSGKIIMATDYGPNGTTTNQKYMKDSDGVSGLSQSIQYRPNYRYWNYGGKTTGGYKCSLIRNTLIGDDAIDENGNLAINELSASYAVDSDNCLFSGFPQVLQDNIVAKKVISASSYIRTSSLDILYDKLWLFSSYEMYKSGGSYYSSGYIDEREGQLYQSQDILDAKGTSSASLSTVNRFYNEQGTTTIWSRTLYSNSSAFAFDATGGIYQGGGGYSSSLAPGFCLP